MHETRGVPHHLIGFVHPDEDYTAEKFCDHSLMAIVRILNKGRIPNIVGGSNNYIKALVEDPKIQLRKTFDCCFLWTDVSESVLYDYVGKRVDQMVELGLVEEAREMYDPEADYSRGIRRAIGAPEMHKYLEVEVDDMVDETEKDKLLDRAIQEIKDNTCELVNRQLEKIKRLRDEFGWKIHRIDATPVFEKCGKQSEETWEEMVMKPSLKIVVEFLRKDERVTSKENHRSNSKEFFGSLKGDQNDPPLIFGS